MNQDEEKLKHYIVVHNIKAEHLSFDRSCHSVAEAAQVANAKPEDFVKNICFLTSESTLIVAIAKGEDRVNTTKIGKVLGIERPLPAMPSQIFELTGYPCGGGSENSLTRLSPQELVQANGAQIVSLRK